MSDIHGNYLALQKVLDDLGKKQYQIVCLGDVVWGGPQPREVITKLRKLSCPMIMGNTDEVVIGKRKERLGTRDVRELKEIGRWCKNTLSASDKSFIKRFKRAVSINLGGERLLCYHGSPRSNIEGIFSTTVDNRVQALTDGYQERFFAGGHTHVQMIRRFKNKVIINPGSVGLPFETAGKQGSRKPTWAEYATIDYDNGNLSVELKRVEYSVRELKEVMLGSEIPYKDWWVRDWKSSVTS